MGDSPPKNNKQKKAPLPTQVESPVPKQKFSYDPVKRQEEEDAAQRLQLKKKQQEKLQKEITRDQRNQKELFDFLKQSNVMEPHQDQYRKEAESIGKAKLLEQNIQLKEQLAQLALELDEVTTQQEDKRIIKRTVKKEPQTDTEALQMKKIELKQQQQEISKLEKHIMGIQKQLETSYDIYKVMAKEDELSILKSEYEALLEERDMHTGVGDKKVKASQLQRNEELYNEKVFIDKSSQKQIKNLTEKLGLAKNRNQELNTEIQQYESDLKKLHKNIKFKEERIKEMEEKIKERMKFPERQFYVTEEELAVLEERLVELENEQTQIDQQYIERMRNLEQERREKQKEADIKIIGVRELEKELKMNQLKFKELAKILRHNVLPPIEREKKTVKLQTPAVK